MLYLLECITLGFEVSSAVAINIPTFWNVEASSLLGISEKFPGAGSRFVWTSTFGLRVSSQSSDGTCHSKEWVYANSKTSGQQQCETELLYWHLHYRRFVGYSDWIW